MFASALRASLLVIKDKIISHEDDLQGVVFYGTKDKRNTTDFENIVVECDADSPDAARILSLEKLLQQTASGGDAAIANAPYGVMSDVDASGSPITSASRLSDALWVTSALFTAANARGAKVSSRRVWLFTNLTDNDLATRTPQRARDQALQKAKDLADLAIQINLFMMIPPDADDSSSSNRRANVVTEDGWWTR